MIRHTIAFGLALFALLCIVVHCPGCSRPEQQTVVETVESSAAVAQYRLLLADCRARIKPTFVACRQRFDTELCHDAAQDEYERCADAIDAELCRTRSVRCADGGVR